MRGHTEKKKKKMETHKAVTHKLQYMSSVHRRSVSHFCNKTKRWETRQQNSRDSHAPALAQRAPTARRSWGKQICCVLWRLNITQTHQWYLPFSVFSPNASIWYAVVSRAVGTERRQKREARVMQKYSCVTQLYHRGSMSPRRWVELRDSSITLLVIYIWGLPNGL